MLDKNKETRATINEISDKIEVFDFENHMG